MIKWNYGVWEGQSIKKIQLSTWSNEIMECEKDNQLKKFNYLLGSAYTYAWKLKDQFIINLSSIYKNRK